MDDLNGGIDPTDPTTPVTPPDDFQYPPDEAEAILMVRYLVGDTPTSVFYPIVSDEVILQILKMEKMNVRKAARMVAFSISYILSTYPYRERTGDIEVWNNASIQYLKVLQTWIKEFSDTKFIPDGAMPYFGGVSKKDMDKYLNDTDHVRSKLITDTGTCHGWWNNVNGYSRLQFTIEGCDCS